MKKVLIVLFGAVLLAGCHTSYEIGLNNGRKITAASRPVLDKDKGIYTFKTADGKIQQVPAGRVISMEAK